MSGKWYNYHEYISPRAEMVLLVALRHRSECNMATLIPLGEDIFLLPRKKKEKEDKLNTESVCKIPYISSTAKGKAFLYFLGKANPTAVSSDSLLGRMDVKP